jgi:predicted phosphohydrolase
MKIQYCSDLHLEFKANRNYIAQHPIQPVGDILLLAGDILPLILTTTYKDFFDYVSDHFEEVFWIAGNHEYYKFDIGKINAPFMEKMRSNVYLVNNQVVIRDRLRLVCSTLWSRIRPENEVLIQQSLNDFAVIEMNGEPLRPSDFNQLHADSMAFLNEALTSSAEATTIVLTHHVPTLQHYPSWYRSPLTDAFAVALDDFIIDKEPDCWIFGHHHTNVKPFTIGKTLMLTNQMGYLQHGVCRHYKTDALIQI